MNQNQNQQRYSIIATAKPVALVLHCGDPRFQEAIRQFLETELGLDKGEYVPFVPAGGVASLSEPENFSHEFRYVRETTGFYINKFTTIKMVILINHEDCGKYRAMHQHLGDVFLKPFGDMRDRQRHDLSRALDAILGAASRELDAYPFFARFANEEKTEVVFERR